jgi:hypothetical protein
MGSEGFDIYLDEINARVIAAIPGAAARAMEMIRTEVARQTPVQDGDLQRSEEVVPHEDGADIYIPGPYARRQHFGLDFHHNVGNALFLELPMVQKAPEAIQMIADDLGKAI